MTTGTAVAGGESTSHLRKTYTVNTVFIDKHCCSSVLMLRSHRLEQSSLICTHCWQRSQLKTCMFANFVASPLSEPLISLSYIPTREGL